MKLHERVLRHQPGTGDCEPLRLGQAIAGAHLPGPRATAKAAKNLYGILPIYSSIEVLWSQLGCATHKEGIGYFPFLGL